MQPRWSVCQRRGNCVIVSGGRRPRTTNDQQTRETRDDEDCEEDRNHEGRVEEE
jgi:hypothetical protein